jgi:hypothetical protein
MARSSVKIGIIMLVAWVIPLFGIILASIGLVQAILSYSSPQKDLARAGLFLNSLGLSLSLILVTVSLYLYFSGVIDPLTVINRIN